MRESERESERKEEREIYEGCKLNSKQINLEYGFYYLLIFPSSNRKRNTPKSLVIDHALGKHSFS